MTNQDLLTAAITVAAPIIAFVGVWFGARMQRGTTRLQLEQQREQTQLLWAREDKHRFAEERRRSYGKFLGTAQKLERDITRMRNWGRGI